MHRWTKDRYDELAEKEMLEIPEIKVKVFEHKDNIYLECKDLMDRKIQYYYEQVDLAILQNMPDELLHKLYEDCTQEIKRRFKEKHI